MGTVHARVRTSPVNVFARGGFDLSACPVSCLTERLLCGGKRPLLSHSARSCKAQACGSAIRNWINPLLDVFNFTIKRKDIESAVCFKQSDSNERC